MRFGKIRCARAATQNNDYNDQLEPLNMEIETLRRLMDERDSISVLATVDVHTGTRSVLKEFDHVIEAPNWTRDGRSLVYNSRGRIYSFKLATGEIEQLDTGFAIDCNNDHVLSPDNTKIAVSHFTNEDATSRIYTLPLAGGTPILVTEKGPSYLHGWSPDGRTLAYCAERNGQYDIYTIAVNGGPETQLTNLPGLDDGPEFSPDGRYIWFNSVRTGLMQIWRMEANGSNPVQMVREEANCWFPHISPDGNWAVYIAYGKEDVAPGDHPANKNVELRLIPASGGPSRTVIRLFGGQGTINVNSWSPDSRTIAFVSYRLKQ
jgi:TolB protein